MAGQHRAGVTAWKQAMYCMMAGMAAPMTLVQARVPTRDVDQLDNDLAELRLASRSEALREGLRLVHRRAEQAALARDYDEFYGGQQAPISDLAAVGHQIAALTIGSRDANR